MRIRAMALAGMILALSLPIGPFIGQATAATVVAVNFSGTIKSVLNPPPGVLVGEKITGSFTYDYTQSAVSLGDYDYTNSSKVHTMSFKVFNSLNQQVFTDQYTGNTGLANAGYYAALVSYTSSTNTAKLDLDGDSLYKQGQGLTFQNTGIPAFDLTLTYANSTGFSPTSLPLPNTTLIQKFINTPGLLTWDPPNQMFTADITQFTLLGVPEPSGLLLGLLSILICAAVIHRRRVVATVLPRPSSPG